MNEVIYIEMAPVPATRETSSACGACTRQDCKDYGPQIFLVCGIFAGAIIGLIIFLVHTN